MLARFFIPHHGFPFGRIETARKRKKTVPLAFAWLFALIISVYDVYFIQEIIVVIFQQIITYITCFPNCRECRRVVELLNKAYAVVNAIVSSAFADNKELCIRMKRNIIFGGTNCGLIVTARKSLIGSDKQQSPAAKSLSFGKQNAEVAVVCFRNIKKQITYLLFECIEIGFGADDFAFCAPHFHGGDHIHRIRDFFCLANAADSRLYFFGTGH